MNKKRRTALSEFKVKLVALIDELEALSGEVDECMYSTLQGSALYEVAESAYGNLSEAADQLNEAVDGITVAVEGDWLKHPQGSHRESPYTV